MKVLKRTPHQKIVRFFEVRGFRRKKQIGLVLENRNA